ncbi:aconitase family protein, partial [Staphylococcus aureus]
AITALGMPERMTLCNMTAELGAKTGLIEPDATTAEWLARTGVNDAEALVAAWQGDPDAPIEAVHRYDASALGPQVAAPHNPANSDDIGRHLGQRV